MTHVAMNRTISRLCDAGYVTAAPYQAIFLTESGRKMAANAKIRHEIVVQFLCTIGRPETAALHDAGVFANNRQRMLIRCDDFGVNYSL